MKVIRVLIADDSLPVRHFLGKVLDADEAIEVVGSCANGKTFLRRLETARPDIAVLDIEMPVMNGLDALRELRKRLPDLPVIMFSSLTAPGAHATFEALRRGATDYVAKPSGVNQEEAQKYIEREIVARIKVLTKRNRAPEIDAQNENVVQRPRGHVGVVAIGASTGGPNALAKVLGELPLGFPVPIVIVQHMPAVFTRIMAQRLNAGSKLSVKEATDGVVLSPGCVYLAPGGVHLEVRRDRGVVRCHLHEEAPVNACRPSVDVLFHSVAESYGKSTLAVVLTGMGCDGAMGALALSKLGAQVIVQDEESSVVWGMPGSVVHKGAAERVVKLASMARELSMRTHAFGHATRAVGT